MGERGMKADDLKKTGLKFLFGIFFALVLPAISFADPSLSYIQNNLDGSQRLTGHVPQEVKNGTAIFKYHANQNMEARIILPLANPSQLSSLLQGLYDPQSPNYHQFLTPTQFAQAFAPSAIDSMEVQEYLNKQGVYVTGQSANGMVLHVTGT